MMKNLNMSDHNFRVAEYCYLICKKEDMSDKKAYDAVCAGLLHDVMKGKKDHAKRGKKFAKERLNVSKRVSKAIGNHNRSKKKILKCSDVSKIVFLADKLDKKNKKKYLPYSEFFEVFEKSIFDENYSLDDNIRGWFKLKRTKLS